MLQIWLAAGLGKMWSGVVSVGMFGVILSWNDMAVTIPFYEACHVSCKLILPTIPQEEPLEHCTFASKLSSSPAFPHHEMPSQRLISRPWNSCFPEKKSRQIVAGLKSRIIGSDWAPADLNEFAGS